MRPFERGALIRVLLQQPVVPHYRVPLFAALAADPDLSVHVLASPTGPGAPASVVPLPDWADASRPCISALGGRVSWQRGVALPLDLGPGDVLVVNGNPRYVSNYPLLLAARRRGVGRIWWGHGWSPTSTPWRARLRYRLMRMADVILLYTDDEISELRRVCPTDAPMFALNNTLETAEIRAAAARWTPAQVGEFRRAAVGDAALMLLFCGRLRASPSTELDVAVRALAAMRAAGTAACLVVIGEGEELGRLQAVARGQGIADQVRWIGPVYREQELAPWFLAADAFVYPGPVGLSLIHALAYGLPVVTHSERRLHNPEIAALEDGVNGLLFQRGDPADLARNLGQFASDPLRAAAMRRAALETVNDRFSFDGMVDRFKASIHAASELSTTRRGVAGR